MMRSRLSLFWAALVMVCLCRPALADGKLFGFSLANARIPDQSALIAFDGHTERLVIETTFIGEGREFAWVVPLPAMPKVEAATTGLFPTLRMITRPRVVAGEPESFVLPAMGLFAGICTWIGILSRNWTGAALIFLLGLCLAGGPLLFTFSEKSGPPPVAAPGGVLVHERTMVGGYETATISGEGGAGILNWLNGNGYVVPASARAVLDQYAREKWYFVAARLRRESAGAAPATPHPLSFTFATDRAVYPLRLTGVENGPANVDLFVAGGAEAACSAFARQRAARLLFPEPNDYSPALVHASIGSYDGIVPIAHEALSVYLRGQSALTVLSATLTPEQMKQDAYLDWKPLHAYRKIFHTRQAALGEASAPAAEAFLIATAACAVLYRRRKPWSWPAFQQVRPVLLGLILGPLYLALCLFLFGLVIAILPNLPGAFSLCVAVLIIAAVIAMPLIIGCALQWRRYNANRESRAGEGEPSCRHPWLAAGAVLVLTVLFGAAAYWRVEKLPAGGSLKWRMFANRQQHEGICESLRKLTLSGEPAEQVAALRKRVSAILEAVPPDQRLKNVFTGLPMREEDSPGNYTIELKNGKPTYCYLDDNGGKVPAWSPGED
jgi:hypothetical protein